MIGEKLEPEGIGTIRSEYFITSIVKSGRFEVVERAMLQKIIAEQNLSTTGLVDASTASQLGQLLGVDVIITGSILKVRNSIDINARIISVQSGSIIAAEDISADTDKNYHDLVKQLTAKIMQNFPLTGYIGKKYNETATIDLGTISRLAVGSEFVVYREGEIIKHPLYGRPPIKRKPELWPVGALPRSRPPREKQVTISCETATSKPDSVYGGKGQYGDKGVW